MHYHIILTEKCNSQCKYCYGKSMKEFDNGLGKKFHFDFSAPADLKINLFELKKFLKQDPESVLIFYGGEPLLQIKEIKKIIDLIDVEFCMQTNGKLLDNLPKKYLNKIHKILISIDGDKKTTDENRGKGTYEKVLKNLNKIKKQGYSGELIARMTISQENFDIYKQAKFLIKRKGFDSVHWQLDAGFYKFDFNKEKFSKFVAEYNQSISKLINYWISEMKKGNVLKFYPFIAIVNSFLKNEKTKLRCGAGYLGYTITTNGKITACPITNNIKEFEAGNLKTNFNDLKKFSIKGHCESCEVKDICGGRCLYWNKTKLWPKTGEELICKTIKHLIKELQKNLPKIKDLISKKIILKKDFEYEKYFGPEIIP